MQNKNYFFLVIFTGKELLFDRLFNLLISGNIEANAGGAGQSSLSIFSTSFAAGFLALGYILSRIASLFFRPAGEDARLVLLTITLPPDAV